MTGVSPARRKRVAWSPIRSRCRRLHRETGGNPFALLELGAERQRLADLPPDAPLATGTSVARVYPERLRTLRQRTRDALAPAAVVDGGEARVLARAAPGPAPDVSDLVISSERIVARAPADSPRIPDDLLTERSVMQ